MNIILVISNEKGKNILFILDNLMALSLDETINYIKMGKIPEVHVVRTKSGNYVRANPNAIESDNLDLISIRLSAMTKPAKEDAPKVIKKYYEKRKEYLKEREIKKEKVLYVDGKPKKTEKEVVSHLSRYKDLVLSASKDLKVDKYLLGAILIDEDLRRDWLDDWLDRLAKLGKDTSVGVAQIKVSTARELIRKGFYNPDPEDTNLSRHNIDKLPKRYLYEYLSDPKHSIYFAGAKINQIIKNWSPYVNLRNKPEIIASLYSLPRKPHPRPEANERGKQIANEFYKLAKRALNE